MGLKRRSVQPSQRSIGYYMREAIESGNFDHLKELVARLKDEVPFPIDESEVLKLAAQIVRVEMSKREMERISKKLRGKP